MHTPPPISFFRISLLVIAFVIASLPTTAQVVDPGGSFDFTSPDGGVVPSGIQGSTGMFNDGQANINSDASPTTPAPLDTRVFATGPLSRGSAEVLQFVEFTVADDGGEERVLMAQVSGQTDIRGFLTLVGLGQSEMSVSLEVVDVTGDLLDAVPQKIVMSEPLADYELVGTFDASAAGGLAVDLGSATFVQVGVDGGGEIGIPMQKQVVRDMVPFGVDLLVRRGHTYRIQLVASSQTKLGVAGGVGNVAFSPAFDVPTNVFDPAGWIDSLEMPLLDAGLRNFNLPESPGGVFSFPTIENFLTEIGGFDVSIRNTRLYSGLPTANTLSDARSRFNIPTTLREALLEFYGNATDRVDEGIDSPGIHLARLEVLVEQDTSEQIAELGSAVSDHAGDNQSFEQLSQQIDDLSSALSDHAGDNQRFEQLSQQIEDLSAQVTGLTDVVVEHSEMDPPDMPDEAPRRPRPFLDFFRDIFR
jgi:hypothetical protein